MGAALGEIFSARGLRVVTTLAGRGERTAARCHALALETLPSLAAVKAVADVVLSVVSPAAATTVAEAYVQADAKAPENVLYVDLNSVAPETLSEIQRTLTRHKVDLVDATIHGLASQLESRGTLYLSGPRADQVVSLFHGALRVQHLGDSLGAASHLKMMLGGMSKGLVALFLELAIAARKTDAYEHFASELLHYYPGIMGAVERLVPTYPMHATRRGVELREIGRTMRAHETNPIMIGAAEKVIVELGDMDLNAKCTPGQRWSVADVIEQTYASHMADEHQGTYSTLPDLEAGGPLLS